MLTTAKTCKANVIHPNNHINHKLHSMKIKLECENRGWLTLVGNTYVCGCPKGYSGIHCEKGMV
jgi:hypothetical protein